MNERDTLADLATDKIESTGAAEPTSHDSTNWKVLGEIPDRDGTGVLGHSTATTGTTRGVWGVVDSGDGRGVYAENTADTGSALYAGGGLNGVVGRGRLVDATGVVGDATAGGLSSYAFDRVPIGVRGETDRSAADSGVDNSAGVYGAMTATQGLGYGVTGGTESPDGFGVAASNYAGGVALVAAGGVLGSGNGDPGSHAGWIQTWPGNGGGGSSTDQVLALQTSYTSDPTSTNNFVTFFDGNDTALGSIEGDGGGGVNYTGTGADYAEFLPRRPECEPLDPGDVVGVDEGGLSHRTDGATRALVVTDQPVVTGNDPGPDEADRQGYERVAFVGQVPTKVRGPVESGDVVVPSGEADGTARAIDPEQYGPDEPPIVGRAWEGSDAAGVTEVTVAVGLGAGEAALEPELDRQGDRIAALEAENERLRAEKRALQDRLADVEERLAALEGGRAGPAVADD